jgi:hypothetical protein
VKGTVRPVGMVGIVVVDGSRASSAPWLIVLKGNAAGPAEILGSFAGKRVRCAVVVLA